MEDNLNVTQEVKNTLTDDAVASTDEPLVSLSPPLTSSAVLTEGGEGVVVDEEKKGRLRYDYDANDGVWHYENSEGLWIPCKEQPLGTRYTFEYKGRKFKLIEIDRECYDSDADSVGSNISITAERLEGGYRLSAIQEYYQKDPKKCLRKADGEVKTQRVRVTRWSPFQWDYEEIEPKEEEVTKSRKRPCEGQMASAREAKRRRAIQEAEAEREYYANVGEDGEWF